MAGLHMFPNFASCPGEHDIDPRYYRTMDGWNWTPRRHWCLLAEIVGIEYFLRLRLLLKDAGGSAFPLAFYLDSGDEPDVAKLKVGHTVAILYAEQHPFLDLTIGIRQEDPKTITVIPATLDYVTSQLQTLIALDKDTKITACQSCKADSIALLACGNCKSRWYCSKECQLNDWQNAGHKNDCKALGTLKAFALHDWDKYETKVGFPL